MTLKEKLLSLNVFEDNEYLDKYVNLIEDNIKTIKEKFKTQRHHIIPKNYYKISRLKIDNSRENIVNLSHKNHIIAHYYLSLCCLDDELRFYNENAFYFLYNCSVKELDLSELGLDKLQILYEDYVKYLSYNNSGNKNPMYGKTLSDEAKDKIRVANIGRVISDETKLKLKRKRSDEFKQKLKDYYKNNGSPLKGKKMTIDEKIKISETTRMGMNIWKKSNLESFNNWKKSISTALKGVSKTIEHRENISRAKIGDKNPMYGKKSGHRKPVICIETQMVYESVLDAIKVTGISHIRDCCKEKLKTAGGYHWKYLENYNDTNRK